MDSKSTTEVKKKSVGELKPKHYKSSKDDQRFDSTTKRPPTTTMEDESSTMAMTTMTTRTRKMMEDSTENASPFLVHGAPMTGPINGDVYRVPMGPYEEKAKPAIHGRTEDDHIMVVTEETVPSRGRALNVTAPEPTNSLHANVTDLSNVSMDDDDKEVEGGEYIASHDDGKISVPTVLLPTTTMCIDGKKTYSMGEVVTRDCEEKCACGEGGKIVDCKPLCMKPLIRAGKGSHDPLCEEKVLPEEPCCAKLVCAEDSAVEPEETCEFRNKTVARGQRVEDGCTKVCVCEAEGLLKCQPRCPPSDVTPGVKQHDRCVVLPDPRDSCCTITLCDVTLGDQEIKAENPSDLSVNLTDVKVLNSTAIKIKLSAKSSEDIVIELSDNNHLWRQLKPDKDGIISNLEPARSYYIRISEGGRPGPALQVSLPAEVIKTSIAEKGDKNMCTHRGKSYKIGAEWYDECISFCTCSNGGKTECITIECPTDSGLDVLDPHCIDWETVPADFEPKPPYCCPQEVRCKNNGSCVYEGRLYDNWSKIPTNVTGCEKECFCDMGNVTCQAACPPVPALPPANLHCPSEEAVLMNPPGDECCVHWACGPATNKPPGKNATTTLTGPLASSKRPNNKSESFGPIQDSGNGDSLQWDPKGVPPYPDTTVHYPMDPGHPTIPYNGPYSPEFRPTPPTVEEVFHLSGQPEKPSPKDKSKSKSDSKKPVESFKPHKESSDQQFLGPLDPGKFLDKSRPPPGQVHEVPPPYVGPTNPNKLPPPQKGNHVPEQAQFVPLHKETFDFGPDNGDVEVDRYEGYHPEARPPYRPPPPQIRPGDPNGIVQVRPDDPNFPQVGPGDPNFAQVRPGDPNFAQVRPGDPNFIGQIRPGDPKMRPDDPNFIAQVRPGDPNFITGSKKKVSIDPFVDDDRRTKPPSPVLKPGQRDQDELYHLINLQHPGLIQLDQRPPQGHPGLYDLHQQISGQKHPGNHLPAGYFGLPSPGKKKPQIFAQKNENGETTYHVHSADIPESPHSIEELLAHINQHDPNPGPFQSYPGQPALTHNLPTGSHPPLIPQIDPSVPHSGLVQLNRPFAAHTPNQSGMAHNGPPNFSIPGGIPDLGPQGALSSSDEIVVKIAEPVDANTVRLVFAVPQVLVGLHGRVDLRYTSDKANFDISTWKSQVFVPPEDIIATPQLEFNLGNLKPSTEYNVKIIVKLKDLSNTLSSKIYSIRTSEITTLPPQIPIDAELRLVETNSTWLGVMWKKFTDYELQFIDGVQLRYKEQDGKVYAATPLIHRAVMNYVIENLKPSTTYEIGIIIVPFPGQATELRSEKTIHATTSMEPDPYAFDVRVEIKTIKSTDVEVSWSGVPYPEDKYVNIYRAIYQSDSGKEDTSTFKIAKRDSPAKTIIGDLKPGTRYRLWIEVYLTNGRIKKSNVQDFVTKPGVSLASGVSQQGKLASIPLHEGDYYGPLVIVAIVASLAILSTLILLMMLMKRRTSSKADISPRKTTSAYDNPSYKTCEDVITNGRNKTSEHEMATINSNSNAKETT
ncbi:putative epidermal cell surface receptor [Orussus abietinus]|uniref:putative epidermal cell surface receptor n=1 Tax=Orussus abietinus TaxID=222816 RepID=UPI000C715F86|nr:putative epidermal cell surface receptor [Orussus abietinus]